MTQPGYQGCVIVSETPNLSGPQLECWISRVGTIRTNTQNCAQQSRGTNQEADIIGGKSMIAFKKQHKLSCRKKKYLIVGLSYMFYVRLYAIGRHT